MSFFKSFFVLGLLILGFGFGSEFIGSYVGPLEYKEFLVFDYYEGDTPITKIVFEVDSKIANNLLITSVPSPWLHTYESGTLTLTGGSLEAGESVLVSVSLNKFFEDGDYVVNSIGTTSLGEDRHTTGQLIIGELAVLNVLALASHFKYPFIGFSLVFGLLEMSMANRNNAGDKGYSSLRSIITRAFTRDTFSRVIEEKSSDLFRDISRNEINSSPDDDLFSFDSYQKREEVPTELLDISYNLKQLQTHEARARAIKSEIEESRPENYSYDTLTQEEGKIQLSQLFKPDESRKPQKTIILDEKNTPSNY